MYCRHWAFGWMGKQNRQKSLLAIATCKEQVTPATKLKVFDCSWHCLLMLSLPNTLLVRGGLMLGH